MGEQLHALAVCTVGRYIILTTAEAETEDRRTDTNERKVDRVEDIRV